MSFKYQSQEIPSSDKTKPAKFYARLISGGVVETAQLMQEIQARCSLTTADVKGALDAIAHVLATHLSEGRRLHLEGIGYFSPRLATRQADTPDIRANYVRIDNVRFRAEKQLCQRLQGAHGEPAAMPRRNPPLAQEEVAARVRSYLADHPLLTRRTFQELTGFLQAKACTELRRLVGEGLLVNAGTPRQPAYVLA